MVLSSIFCQALFCQAFFVKHFFVKQFFGQAFFVKHFFVKHFFPDQKQAGFSIHLHQEVFTEALKTKGNGTKQYKP